MAANRIYIQVDFQQQGAVAGVNQLNQAISAIGPTTQKASQQASQGISSLSLTLRQTQQSFGGLASAIAGLGLARGGQQVLQVAADIDTLRKTLELWEGSQAAGNSRFNQFLQMSQKAGISLEPAIKAFSRLRGANVSAQESIRIIQGFGRALGQMGKGGEDLTGVIEQVTQSISKRGNIMREDLKFIQQYVPQVTGILEKLYGTSSTEELAKMPGLTSARVWREVTAELLKLQEATPGIQKMMDRFWQEMRLGAEAAGQALATELKPQMEAVIQAVKDLTKWWQELNPAVRKAIVYIFEAGVAIGGVSAAVWGIGKAIAGVAAVAAANPVVMTLLGLGAAGAYLRYGAPAQNPLNPLSGQNPFRRQIENTFFPEGPPRPAAPGVPAGWLTLGMAGVEQKDQITLSDEQEAAALRARKRITDLERDLNDELQQAVIARRKIHDEALTEEQQYQRELGTLRMEAVRDREKRLSYIDEKTGELKRIRPTARAEELFRQIEGQKEAALFDESMSKLNARLRKEFEETFSSGFELYANMLERQNEAFSGALTVRREYLERSENERLEIQLRNADAQRDLALAGLEQYEDATIEQQIALSQKRLEIENEYVGKALAINLQLLEADRKRVLAAMELKAIADQTLGSPAYQQARQAAEDYYTLRSAGMESEAAAKKEANRLKAVGEQAKIVRTEMQKTFEYFQRLAEGVFDALLDKSKSVTQAMADFFRTTFLTMLKAIYTNAIAIGMMRLFGMPVPAQPGAVPGFSGLGGLSGGMRGGGGSWWQQLFGGIGGGRSPLGPGGWLSGIVGGPGGTGGFAGPVSGGGYGVNAVNQSWLGALAGIPGIGKMAGIGTAGKLGIGGLLGSLGLFNAGSIAMGPGVATTAAGIGGLGGALAGFASSPGGILAGLTLAYMGAKKRGPLGVAMGAGGGALAGFGAGAMTGAIGGPVGMAIGAAIGGGIALFSSLRKSAEEKMREQIRRIYGVDIQSKQILQQLTDIVKTQFGGDMNVGVYSPQIRELVQLYAMTQGVTARGMGRPMYPVSWALSGGTAALQPVWSNGSLVANPYAGPTTTQLTPGVTYIQLNPQQASELFEGRVVQVIDKNPAVVANSASSGMEPSYIRSRERGALIEPMTLM